MIDLLVDSVILKFYMLSLALSISDHEEGYKPGSTNEH